MAFLHGRGWHSKETQASSSNGNGITYTLATLSKSSGKSEKELSRLDPTSHNHLIQMLSDFFYVKVQDPTTSEYATMAAAILKYHPFFADSLLDIQCCDSVKKQLSQRFQNLRRASHDPQVQKCCCMYVIAIYFKNLLCFSSYIT